MNIVDYIFNKLVGRFEKLSDCGFFVGDVSDCVFATKQPIYLQIGGEVDFLGRFSEENINTANVICTHNDNPIIDLARRVATREEIDEFLGYYRLSDLQTVLNKLDELQGVTRE